MDNETRGSVRVEQGAKRVRVYLAGRLVADTRRPFLVWEIPYYPAYYLPVADVLAEPRPHRQDRALAEQGRRTSSSTSGWTARPQRTPPNATRTPRSRRCATLVRFDWAAMDEWLEEDEPVYTHPRDPYKRVDILASSRHVRVEVDGVTVADSVRPHILFETGLPPRYYLPLSDIRTDLLTPSDTSSHCPYKGTAGYWSVDAGHGAHPDLVVDLPHAVAREPEDRRPGLLLQREGRPLCRRGTPGPPPLAVQLRRPRRYAPDGSISVPPHRSSRRPRAPR